MKFLIWFLCILAYAIFTAMLRGAGVILGAVPTIILWLGLCWLARTLCKKWDEKNS